MVINFNLEKLNELLENFYNLTGISISVCDKDFNFVASKPQSINNYCLAIKLSKKGADMCFNSDKELFNQCKKTGQICSHICHAGMQDTAIPINHEGIILGYIIFGQTKGNNNLSYADIQKIAEDYTINAETLWNTYQEINLCSNDKIISSGYILEVAIKYLLLANCINIRHNHLASEIADYIRENLCDKISIEDLCRKFFISKNKLYRLFQQNYNCTTHDYILNERLKTAKLLLQTSDLSIYEIAVRSGITDYNYFTKVFKARVGSTPSQFRKNNSTLISLHMPE